MSSNSGQYTQ